MIEISYTYTTRRLFLIIIFHSRLNVFGMTEMVFKSLPQVQNVVVKATSGQQFGNSLSLFEVPTACTVHMFFDNGFTLLKYLNRNPITLLFTTRTKRHKDISNIWRGLRLLNPKGGCAHLVIITTNVKTLATLLSTSGYSNSKYALFFIYFQERADNFLNISSAELRNEIGSETFQHFHPKAILLVEQLQFIVCFLCEDKLFLINEELILENLKALIFEANSDGHGAMAFSPGVKFEDERYFKDSEAEMWKTWEYSWTGKVLLGIMSNLMNFTFSNSEIPRPRLAFCFLCEMPLPNDTNNWNRLPNSKAEQDGTLLIVRINNLNFMYCLSLPFYNHEIIPRSVAQPFDKSTWLCIVVIIIVVSIYRRSLWLGLSVLWEIFGLPPTTKSGNVIIAISLAMVVVQQFYSAEFTSNVIKPYEPDRISDGNLLFQQGFQTFEWDDKGMKRFLAAQESIYAASGMNASKLCRIETRCNHPDPRYCVGQFPNDLTYVVQLHLAPNIITGIESITPNVRCKMVVKTWYVSWDTITFHSHLSERFGQLFSRILQMGLWKTWDNILSAGRDREAFRKPTKHSGGDGIITITALFPLLRLCLILITLSFLVFLIEFLSFQCKQLSQLPSMLSH